MKNPTTTTTNEEGIIIMGREYEGGDSVVEAHKGLGWHKNDRVTQIRLTERPEYNPYTGYREYYPIVQTIEHFTFGVADKKGRLLGMKVQKIQVHLPETTVWYVETSHTRNGQMFRSGSISDTKYHESYESCNQEAYTKLEASLKKAANFGTKWGYK